MKFKKALKKLLNEGDGFITRIESMNTNVLSINSLDRYLEKMFKYGYCLRYIDYEANTKEPCKFQFVPVGTPFQYIDIVTDETAVNENEEGEWGYYSFSQFATKFPLETKGLYPKIRFGLNQYCRSISDKQYDLYGTW